MTGKDTPTNREIRLTDTDLMVSKTDPRGNITYCNRAFMRISGYNEKQVLNAQHNIVRHPDMPRGIYRHMWQTLQQGKEYFGYIKNLSSDGSYYWQFIHIVPDVDPDEKLQGYFAVRRKPRADAIASLEPIYKEMLALEKRENKEKAPDLSLALLHERLKQSGTSYERFMLHQ